MVSGYTLTIFPNAIHATTAATRSKSKSNNKQQQPGPYSTRNRGCAIIIQDSERCLIIDVAIPSDYNIQKKATERMTKYVGLQTECQRMWNKKAEGHSKLTPKDPRQA